MVCNNNHIELVDIFNVCEVMEIMIIKSLEILAKRFEGRTIHKHEFNQIAALKLRLNKEESNVLRKDLVNFGFMKQHGSHNRFLYVKSSSLNVEKEKE
jgi:hypothetical protein